VAAARHTKELLAAEALGLGVQVRKGAALQRRSKRVANGHSVEDNEVVVGRRLLEVALSILDLFAVSHNAVKDRTDDGRPLVQLVRVHGHRVVDRVRRFVERVPESQQLEAVVSGQVEVSQASKDSIELVVDRGGVPLLLCNLHARSVDQAKPVNSCVHACTTNDASAVGQVAARAGGGRTCGRAVAVGKLSQQRVELRG